MRWPRSTRSRKPRGTGHRRVLLVSLYDLPRDPGARRSGRTEARARSPRGSSASDDPDAQAAAAQLDRGARKRSRSISAPAASSRVSDAWFEPGVEALVRRASVAVAHLARPAPKLSRCPARTTSIRNCFTSSASACSTRCCRRSHAFLAQISADAPTSHRALGRSSFIAAARSVDRKLLRDLGRLRFPAQRFADQHASRPTTSSRRDKFSAEPVLPLPPADRRSRARQARPLRDRHAPRRRSGARAVCSPKSAASSTSS